MGAEHRRVDVHDGVLHVGAVVLAGVDVDPARFASSRVGHRAARLELGRLAGGAVLATASVPANVEPDQGAATAARPGAAAAGAHGALRPPTGFAAAASTRLRRPAWPGFGEWMLAVFSVCTARDLPVGPPAGDQGQPLFPRRVSPSERSADAPRPSLAVPLGRGLRRTSRAGQHSSSRRASPAPPDGDVVRRPQGPLDLGPGSRWPAALASASAARPPVMVGRDSQPAAAAPRRPVVPAVLRAARPGRDSPRPSPGAFGGRRSPPRRAVSPCPGASSPAGSRGPAPPPGRRLRQAPHDTSGRRSRRRCGRARQPLVDRRGRRVVVAIPQRQLRPVAGQLGGELGVELGTAGPGGHRLGSLERAAGAGKIAAGDREPGPVEP